MNYGKAIYTLAKGNTLASSKYASVSPEEQFGMIRKEIFEALGIDENCGKKAFRKAVRKNKVLVYEIVEEIVDNILENGDYQKDAFFNQFVELKTRARDEDNKFYVEGDRELTVVEYSGSHFDLNRKRYDIGASFGVEVKTFGIKVYEYFERIMVNQDFFSDLVADVAKAVNKKLTELAQDTFATAITNLPTTFKPLGGSLDTESAIELVQKVEGVNGATPVILGTKLALEKFQAKVLQTSEKSKDAINEVGFVREWQGTQCIELKQGIKNGTFEFTMDNNKIYVMASNTKLVKMYIEGDTEMKEIQDGVTNADRSVEYTIDFRAGACVAYSGMIGVIDLA